MSRRTFWDEPRASVFCCNECSEQVPSPDDVAFDSHCAKCNADLHSCRNCAFFDTAAENECLKPVPVRYAKKRANNDCTLFRPMLAVNLKGDTGGAAPNDDARKAWDALFK